MAERNEAGPGRMAEPAEILAAIERVLTPSPALLAPPPLVTPPGSPLTTTPQATARRPLAGRHVLVTSGPTHEPIDPVRYIANRSSGKQGHAIAAAAAALGARVTLVSGPTNLADPAGVDVVRIEAAHEMLAAVLAALPADCAIFAAAVADWRVASAASEKIKKDGKRTTPKLELVENADILKTIAHEPAGRRPPLVIGFAAETENVVAYAQKKRQSKGCDWIVANDVSPETGIMGGDRNTVHLVTADGVESWPEMDKAAVAEALVARAAAHLLSSTAAV